MSTPIRAALAEVERVAELVSKTQPIWAGNLRIVTRAARLALAATEPAEPAELAVAKPPRPFDVLSLTPEQFDKFAHIPQDCIDAAQRPKGYSEQSPAATEIRAAPSEPDDGIQAKRLDVIVWLLERRDNAQRIAMHKSGADKAGWLEDAGYFNAAASLVNSLAALRPSAAPSEPDLLQEFSEAVEIGRKLLSTDPARPSAVLEAAPEPTMTMEQFVAHYDAARGHEIRHSPTTLALLHCKLLAALRASTPSPSPTGEKP